jgi:hypothetical protein
MAAIVEPGLIGVAVTTSLMPANSAEQKQGQGDAAQYAKLNGFNLGLADAETGRRKAVNATLGDQASTPFEVELMTENGSQTDAVDARTGKVNQVADTTAGENGTGEDAE